MNTTSNTGVGCDIELKNGSPCGIPAIGRCSTCERAFCMTHQGRFYDSFHELVSYVDMCAPCAAVRQAEDAKRRTEAMAPYDYFKSGAARTDLLTSGVPPVNIYQVGRRWEPKKGFFGGGGRYIEGVSLFGRGWILGEFPWEYSVRVYRDSQDVRKTSQTALMDMSPEEYERLSGLNHIANSTLIRVESYSEGYQVLFELHDHFIGSQSEGWGWREAMQAVKRLTGKSS